MKSLTLRLILMLSVLFGGVQPLHASISTRYAADTQLNQSNREVNEALKKKHILERIRQDFERLYEIPSITMTTRECNQANAFYNSGKRTIELCLELVKDAYNRAKMVSKKPSERAALVGGSIRLVLAHELGHALAHLYGLPITGREEDFADQISLFTTLHGKGSQYGISSAMLIHNGNDSNLADVHSLDTQRRISIVCWAWGYSHKDFNFAANRIPQYRKETCSYEYTRIDYAIRRLLGNHLKNI